MFVYKGERNSKISLRKKEIYNRILAFFTQRAVEIYVFSRNSEK